MKEFFGAALPWVILGLCVACYAAGFGRKEDASKGHEAAYVSIGAAAGIVLSLVLKWNLALGISLGMLWGMVFSGHKTKK